MNVDAYRGKDSEVVVKNGTKRKKTGGNSRRSFFVTHGFGGPILPERYLDEATFPDLEQDPIPGGE